MTTRSQRTASRWWLTVSVAALLDFAFWPVAGAVDLPVPCIGANCVGGPSVWVTGGEATASVSGNTFTVNQQSDRAILNWASFNVGADGEVVFRQPDETSIALNRIFQQDPSAILGAVSANGQVYLINPNGLVFGDGARINVQSLIASTLDVDDGLFQSVGVVRAIDQDGQAAFEGGTAPDARIAIEQGAELTAAGGGRIVVLAPEIVNEGRINTPDGQALLAASTDRVYLQASNDSDLRGLLVEVETGGSVTNLGDIVAERGNVTLAGLAVNQQGNVTATTSVRSNGSVRLLARDQAQVVIVGSNRPVLETTNAGTLTLGEGSVTQVVPELDDAEQAVDEQAQGLSRIEMMGRQITFENDSLTRADGGFIDIQATVNPRAVGSAVAQNDAQVFLADGAVIDASGDGSAVVPMERNVVEIELRGNELADAPIQRDGVLRGEAVRIDVRIGTPVANVDGALASIERGVGERLSTGGTVNIAAEGSVVVNEGARIDVSGGQVRYEDGIINTTQLVSDGELIDIGEADPNVVYDAIATGYVKFHERWGVTETFPEFGGSAGRFERGYVEGRDAGTIAIAAPDAVLNGRFVAQRTVGELQRRPTDFSLAVGQLRPFDQIPAGGLLNIDLARVPQSRRDVIFGPGAPTVIAPGAPLPPGRIASVPLSVFSDGVQQFALATNGGVTIGSDTDINIDAGGAFNVTASRIDMAGQIRIPSGRVALTSSEISGANAPIVIDDSAVIDVSGQFVNDFLDAPDDALGPLDIDGGDIEINAAGDLEFRQNARLVANGGVHVFEDGAVEGGRGGNVSLAVGLDREDSRIDLAGQIDALALTDGGTLSLEANRIVLGAEPDADPNTLILAPEFFEGRGFSAINLTSNRRGILINNDTPLALTQRNLALQDGYLQVATGSALPVRDAAILRPDLIRGPVSLFLTSTLSTVVDAQSVDADIVWDPSATIELDPEATVTLNSQSSVIFDGTLIAPSADVSLIVSNEPESAVVPLYRPTQQVRLGAGSLIDTRGRVLVLPDDSGYRRGRVTSGGRVTLAAQRGAVIAETGSRVDVSGISGVLDLTISDPVVLEPVRVTGAAGTIDVSAAEAIVLDGDLIGRSAGTADSEGGVLNVLLDQNLRGVDVTDPVVFPTFPTAPPRLTVSATRSPFVIGRDQPLPDVLEGQAFVSAPLIDNGGFARVSLGARDYISANVSVGGGIVIDNGVDVSVARSLVLDAAVIQMNGGTASFNAPYVVLGSSQQPRRDAGDPVAGTGQLVVSGQTVDLRGALTLNGVDQFDVLATDDVRLRGELPERLARELTGQLASAGSVSIAARRLYPGILSDYAIDLTGESSRFTLTSPAAADAPLSAAGRIAINARDIEIDGNLFAPLGSISLNATDSLTLQDNALVSVGSDEQRILFGRTQGELDWVYPLSGTQNLIFGSGTNTLAPPERRVEFDANTMSLSPDAVINLSGGGDVLAYEFVPGPGGSSDILDPAVSPGSFAVVPSYALPYAPIDPLESQGFSYEDGTRIVVAAGSALPAGEYTVLPPRYALLPGAFLLTERSDTLDALPGIRLPDSDGIPIVAGRFAAAGSGASDTRWQGFRVENGQQVRARAEYVESEGNTFFAQQAQDQDLAAPLLARDAGSLVLSVGDQASLRAQVLADGAQGGVGGRVDIAAARIEVVQQTGSGTGGVELLADELNALSVDSLTLGGVRRQVDNQTELETQAESVTVADNVSLAAPEIIIVGQDVALGDGVALTNSGTTQSTQNLVTAGDGALVVVSSADIQSYQRVDAQDTGGSLSIGEGAALTASRSLILDSTGDIDQRGTIGASGGRVTLSAARIGLGDAPADASGLILDATQINQLDASELVLLSRSAVDLFSDLDVTLARLELRGAGLIGRQPAGLSATLRVDEFALSNPFDAGDDSVATGTGALEIIADTLVFGDGAYRIDGFDTIDLTGRDAVIGRGDATLTLAADASILTAALVGDAGAFLTVDAGAFGLDVASSTREVTRTGGLGAGIALRGGDVRVATTVLAPSGSVSVTGDTVAVEDGAVLDASGRTVAFGDVSVSTAGGTVAMAARTGDVNVATDARIDVSGGGDERAGALLVTAAEGTARLDGAIVAGGGRADATIDVGTLGDFSALNSALAGGGFDGARAVRVRNGDLVVTAADSVNASDIALAADNGAVRVDGVLQASGGRVALDAQDAVVVNGRIDVRAPDGGGDIALRAAGDDAEVTLASSSVLDLGGGALRVAVNETGRPLSQRVRSDGVVRDASAAVFAPERTVTADGDLTAVELIALIETLLEDAAALDTAFLDTLNGGGVPWETRPSLVVSAANDLTLSGDVSLLDQRANGAPGALTLRAGGTLTIDGTLSDGAIEATDFAGRPITVLDSGPSFDVTLVAGADANAVAINARNGTGALVLTDGSRVRTGTGDLTVAAGGDLRLGEGASIYTMGASTGPGNLPDALVEFVFQGVEYPELGGNLRIEAGGDILAQDAGQFVNEWLFRAGGPSASAGDVPTLYGVFIENFAQTFGAFGGGDVSVLAGGGIRNVSVALPATAQHAGDAFLIPGTIQLVTSDNTFVLRDSGSLDLSAGGDISGLLAYVATGDLRVRSGGSIRDRDDGLGAVLMLGDARADVRAVGGINIESILNPTVLPQTLAQNSLSAFLSQFFTYGERSAARLVSLAGDVTLDNDRNLLASLSSLNFGNSSSGRRAGLQIYPSRVFAAALRGNVRLNNEMTLFPDPNGNLDLLAFGNVETVGANASVRISNADVALLPFSDRPEATFENIQRRLTGAGRGLSEFVDAAIPVHISDDEPSRIVTLDGSITSSLLLNVISAERLDIRAAQDVRNLNLLAQNVRESDVTRVVAGRDVRFDTTRNENGRISNRTAGFEIAGPGRLDVIAGRNIDLGASDGVLSIGDRLNATLADRGADVTLLAGLADGADFDGFANEYFVTSTAFQSELEAYVLAVTGEALTGQMAVQAFLALPDAAREPLVLATFFSELRESGIESPDPEIGFDRGYAAIDTLFPGTRDSESNLGDLRIFFSRVQTTDGGDITIAVPGGEVNAGLAAIFEGAKPADELGIVVQGEGDISGYVRDDFLVNQSRVFALDGGDILIWSTLGDIDAGRGAKTALAAPEPLVTLDSSGNIVVEFPPTISGSGIRAGVSSRGREPGDVFLFAPAGVVSAGDAGIGSAGNVTIAATEVIGADNIDVGGVAIGVPVDTGGVAAGLAGVSNATAGAANAATEQVADGGQSDSGDDESLGNAALAWLEMFILGFGDDDDNNRDDNEI